MVYHSYSEKNIDLAKLVKCIESFFQNRNSKTVSQNSSNKAEIVAVPSYASGIREEIRVIVSTKEEVEVEFLGGAHSEFLRRVGILTTFLGGGIFVLKGLESKEKLKALEREFWNYLDATVSLLVEKGQSLTPLS